MRTFPRLGLLSTLVVAALVARRAITRTNRERNQHPGWSMASRDTEDGFSGSGVSGGSPGPRQTVPTASTYTLPDAGTESAGASTMTPSKKSSAKKTPVQKAAAKKAAAKKAAAKKAAAKKTPAKKAAAKKTPAKKAAAKKSSPRR